MEEQGTWASRTQKHSEAGYGRSVDRGAWTAKTVKRPRQQPAHPQYANYWVPLTRKRHTMPHSAQPQHTNYWAPRTEHGNDTSKSTGRSGRQKAATHAQHAKGRTGDCPGPRKGATTRRNVTQGVGRGLQFRGFEWDICPTANHCTILPPVGTLLCQCHIPLFADSPGFLNVRNKRNEHSGQMIEVGIYAVLVCEVGT